MNEFVYCSQLKAESFFRLRLHQHRKKSLRSFRLLQSDLMNISLVKQLSDTLWLSRHGDGPPTLFDNASSAKAFERDGFPPADAEFDAFMAELNQGPEGPLSD
jgi:hypothetical protein